MYNNVIIVWCIQTFYVRYRSDRRCLYLGSGTIITEARKEASIGSRQILLVLRKFYLCIFSAHYRFDQVFLLFCILYFVVFKSIFLGAGDGYDRW